MISFKIGNASGAALFIYDKSFNSLRLTETQDFNEFDRGKFEVYEDRKEVDGSEMPQFGLLGALGALVADEEKAPAIREALNQGGAKIAEATFVSQFGTYYGFRSFSLYKETPEAPVLRTLTSPANPELWRTQFYTPQFVEWLEANFDTRGLSITRVDRDPYFHLPDRT